MADVLDLQSRIKGLTVPPDKMVGGAAALIEEVAASKITGEEDRYSHTDLWDFQANLDGAEKIVDLLRPLTAKADPALSARIDENFATVDQILAKYKTEAGGFETYDKLTPEDRKALQGPVTMLAEDSRQAARHARPGLRRSGRRSEGPRRHHSLKTGRRPRRRR